MDDKRTANTIFSDSSVNTENESKTVKIQSGESVNGFIVTDILTDKGSEADVYLAQKDGKQFVIKLYKRKIQLDNVKMDLLKELDCPYIAKLIDFGTYQEWPYEVYPYFVNGSIENIGRVEGRLLKEYINQLNIGIHKLHTISKTDSIIHGDIKPQNIFLSDDRQSLIIGDFGVSAIMRDANFKEYNGTPEFSPPSIGVGTLSRRTPAFDYGSLGLVIFYLSTGYSYFEGWTIEDIGKGWVEGISIPDNVDSRVRRLMEGLLVVDEYSRLGYEEITSWYDGAFITLGGQGARKPIHDPEFSYRMGNIDGESIIVTSANELVRQFLLHWDIAKYKIMDENLYLFIKGLDGSDERSKKIKEIAESEDRDSAVFKILYLLSKRAEINYKGKNYKDPSAMLDAIENGDTTATELLLNGLFCYYLSVIEYPYEQIHTVKEIINNNLFSKKLKTELLKYLFKKEKIYNNLTSVEDMCEHISNLTIEEIEKLTEDEKFIAWLYTNGQEELAKKLLLNGE